MRRGGIGVCVATQIARYVKRGNPLPGWHSPEQAWAQTQGQLAWYRAMEERGEMKQIKTRAELKKHGELWQDAGRMGCPQPAAHDHGVRRGEDTAPYQQP